MKVWKVGHKDESKWFCQIHGGQRMYYLPNPHNERQKAKKRTRVDTWRRPQGEPLE